MRTEGETRASIGLILRAQPKSLPDNQQEIRGAPGPAFFVNFSCGFRDAPPSSLSVSMHSKRPSRPIEEIIMNTLTTAIAAITGAVAVNLSIAVPASLSGSLPPAEGQARYRPIQSISYEFGSKRMSGYFVAQDAACLVTLMISETGDPELEQPLSAARVRLQLHPGQMAGLDSEEGRSLNFTCGDNAAVLLVDAGGRDRLVELQADTVAKQVARSH
jgi:hypothetical protein